MDEPQEKSPYPPDCRFEVLDANLATLEQRSSGLPERIRRAAGSRHVTAPDDDPGALFYNLGVYHFALPLEREEAERGLADDVPEGTEPRRLLVFGLGLGEQLELVLRRFPRARVVAWERDPWLLRLVLMRRDWSPWIRSGRLQFILGRTSWTRSRTGRARPSWRTPGCGGPTRSSGAPTPTVWDRAGPSCGWACCTWSPWRAPSAARATR